MCDITVPGHWQLQGFDRPVYTNISTHFRASPGSAEANPTGVTSERLTSC